MDTVTHGLAGWLTARALPSESGRKEAAAAVILGSVLPDADNVVRLLGSEMYLKLHRGFSHGFAGVAVTSLLIALLLYRFGKWKDLKTLYLFALLGQLLHISLDLLNSYGTQIFQPFSDARVAFDILFVIDLVFTGIIVAGLALSRRRARPARVAMAVLAGYVGFAAILHLRALEAVRSAAVGQGVPVVSAAALPRLGQIRVGEELARIRLVGEAWARQELSGLPDLPIPEQRNRFPFPAGPFAWNGIVDDGDTFLRGDVEPFTGSVAWKQRVRRGQDVALAFSVEEIPEVRTYLWFARFPVVQESREGSTRILTFSDLRFGGVPGRRRPFRLQIVETPGLAPQALWGR